MTLEYVGKKDGLANEKAAKMISRPSRATAAAVAAAEAAAVLDSRCRRWSQLESVDIRCLCFLGA